MKARALFRYWECPSSHQSRVRLGSRSVCPSKTQAQDTPVCLQKCQLRPTCFHSLLHCPQAVEEAQEWRKEEVRAPPSLTLPFALFPCLFVGKEERADKGRGSDSTLGRVTHTQSLGTCTTILSGFTQLVFSGCSRFPNY